MNVDNILNTLNRHRVDYILIGGMNFLLRHKPVLTFDVDVWLEDLQANLRRCEQALGDLNAEWGRTDEDWKPVDQHAPGWLEQQAVFCLTSPYGAIDIFRNVTGLQNWKNSAKEAYPGQTAGGVPYLGLSDADMLNCQLALEESQQKKERIATLQEALRAERNSSQKDDDRNDDR